MLIGLILAAGKGSRMGQNKMLAKLNKKPLLHYCLDAAEGSNLDRLIIVTGHESERVQASIHRRNFHLPLYGVGKPLTMIENPRYEEGLATSLQTGLEAAQEADAVMVLLGDMPFITPSQINTLLAAFTATSDIIVPTHQGEFGNPILWGKAHFAELRALKGDKGARSLLASHPFKTIELNTTATQIDIDTPELLQAYQT